MTRKAFDKIAAGLREATAMARGESAITVRVETADNRASRGGGYNPTLSSRTPIAIRRALEAYADSRGITLSKASCAILEDWLQTHGWLAGTSQKPSESAADG